MAGDGDVAAHGGGDELMATAPISASSSGDNTIVPAVTGKKIVVKGVVVVAAGTVSVKWRSGSTDKTGAVPLVANGGYVLPVSTVGWLETVAGEALVLNLSGAVLAAGHIVYTLE